ncbi:hypothetical protein HPP92_004407 [Vanilla planifolia]|uniref:Cellulose synthase-like protein H1 n=1 Tax=Vanilla planifolia TaxID=51239 RepID=A0A835RWQ2_VANPL|nr:hypothetical protein HPP92_004407 [Vanilla planifolia]
MGEDGVPHLVYVSREKRPKHGHHFKAGAMNVLSRVSGVMTNAPYMLNVDCDMFANNPKVILHGMCLLLGFEDESSSGYAQAPQRFYGGLKDDPFGNQLVVINRVMTEGFSGIQGPLYGGTGCFHRRKAIYGSRPPNLACNDGLSYKELKRRFGNSRELIESPKEVMADEFKGRQPWACEISSAIDISKQVASCTFEHKTCWGREVGWVYGSMVEDVMTGIRIQAMGWKSVYFKPEPSAFVGCAPTDGPGSLVQYKRWATGLLEVLLDRDYSPIAAARTKRLRCRQALAYLTFNVWALRCIPELIYSLLPAYCLITGNTIWPRASEREFLLPAAVFVGYNLHSMNEYLWCGLSLRAWWNNQRMQRITVVTSFLLGLLSVVVKLLGISDTVFEITRKEQRHEAGPNAKEDEPGRFTFDDSPIFVSGTALVLVQLAALAAAAIRLGAGSGGGGLGEAVCCGWVVASFWPFVRGFFGRGRYGIPWSVMLKAGLLAFVFVVICPTALLKHLH